MSEWLLVAAIVLAGSSGLPGLIFPCDSSAGERWFAGLMALGASSAGLGAGIALGRGAAPELGTAWTVPGGHLVIGVDAISAIFVFQIALLALLGVWYGLSYWPQRSHPENGRKLRAFYGAITAGMLTLVVARNSIVFLFGWEVMALSAFVLVSTEDEHASVRQVGYLYLLATHAGTLSLFAMFALLGAAGGTFDLAGWPRALASPLRDAIFVLALAGFGLKAGLMPLHIWLPAAHATAPSHVSALMSGVLIKTGIYGLVRLTSCCAEPPLWWGQALVGLGAVSGVLGVAYALGQHDLKRLLAYHSVENIGIICIGLGLAVLGRSLGNPELVVLGLAGALLHVVNHGLFKALLFLGAGCVLHATGTREIDQLGGLSRRMPWTALAFLIGALAICGLPPLNGLISELFIYLGLLRTAPPGGRSWIVGALGAPALALIGALALACFVKVFGGVFLGHPRSRPAEGAHEADSNMLLPMAVLAGLCLAIGLGAPLVSPVLDSVIRAWARASGPSLPPLSQLVPLAAVSAAGAGLLLLALLFGRVLLRRARAGAARLAPVGTWDCGYLAPSARMQYTASSFAQLLLERLGWALRPVVHPPLIRGIFPRDPANFHSHLPDLVLDRAILPAFSQTGRLFGLLRPLQRGSIHLYLSYIVLTLLVLLLWR